MAGERIAVEAGFGLELFRRDHTGEMRIEKLAGAIDRTGTVVALALDVAGVPHDEIVADYLLTAERLEAIIGRLLPRPSYGEALARQDPGEQLPRPESIEAILSAVADGWGGAAGWLRGQGWTVAEVERLRDRLTLP